MASEVVTFDELPSLKGTKIVGAPFVVTQEDQLRFDVASWVKQAYAGADVAAYPDDLLEGFFALSLVDAVTVSNTPGDQRDWWGLNYYDPRRASSGYHRGNGLRYPEGPGV